MSLWQLGDRLPRVGPWGRRDRVLGTPEGGWGTGAHELTQVLPRPAWATHRRLKVEPRKEGRSDSATVATV